MGSVKEMKKKKQKRTKHDKLNRNLKHVAKILSKYKLIAQVGKGSKSPSKETEPPAVGSPSDWNLFIQIRENSFALLQKMVDENWSLTRGPKLPDEKIEAVSLQMEQKALLACMQSHIYKIIINLIISEIQRATDEKKLHPYLERFLNGTAAANKVGNVKREPDTAPSLPSATTLKSSPERTVGAPRRAPQLVVVAPTPVPLAQPPPLPTPPSGDVKPLSRVEPRAKHRLEPDSDQISADNFNKQVSSMLQHLTKNDIACGAPPAKLVKHSETICPPAVTEDAEDMDDNDNDFPADSFEQEPQGHIESDHNAEIESLMHILEGSDEEGQVDLDTRISQLQDGVPGLPFNHQAKAVANDLTGKPQPKMWAIDRYIFMYKIMAGTARMSARRYCQTRDMFMALFGDDSDDEHEEEFMDREKFIANCVRRVLPTVTRYLMPFYSQRRIPGGSIVFKHLVRRIADSLIDVKDYPSDRDIRDFVNKFFPGKQVYKDFTDVWCFTPLE